MAADGVGGGAIWIILDPFSGTFKVGGVKGSANDGVGGGSIWSSVEFVKKKEINLNLFNINCQDPEKRLWTFSSSKVEKPQGVIQ